VHQEHSLENLLKEHKSKWSAHKQLKPLAHRRSKMQKMHDMQTRYEEKRQKRVMHQITAAAAAQKGESRHISLLSHPVIKSMQPDSSPYATFLYLKLLREVGASSTPSSLESSSPMHLAWEFIQDGMFTEWMGVRGDLWGNLATYAKPSDQTHGEDKAKLGRNLLSSTGGIHALQQNPDLELRLREQELLFGEILKHLEHRNDSEKTLEFLKMFFEEFEPSESPTESLSSTTPKTPLAQLHPILTKSSVWGQLFLMATTTASAEVSNYISSSWQRLHLPLVDTQRYTDDQLALLYRTLIQTGHHTLAHSVVLKRLAKALTHNTSHVKEYSILFDEMLRNPSVEISSLVVSMYTKTCTALKASHPLSNSRFAQHPKVLSSVLQAHIDVFGVDKASQFFNKLIVPVLEYGVVFPRDTHHLVMPLMFAFMDTQEWDLMASFARELLLKRSQINALHPDILYIAALAFNRSNQPQLTLQLSQTYPQCVEESMRVNDNWRFTSELIRAHGINKDYDTCFDLFNAAARNVAQIDENSQILAQILRVLMENGQETRANEALNVYTSAVMSKQMQLPYVPRSVITIMPVLKYYGDKKDVSSMLYLLNQVWPEPLYDPAPLVDFLEKRCVDENTSVDVQNHISGIVKSLREERRKFLQGTETDRIVVGKK